MINERTWEDFKETGLLWWINSILHTFGWSIVFSYNDNQELINVYPARVKFRGFGEKQNTEGYIKVSKYIKENCEELLKEAQE